jgi:hypothetical protein
VEKVFSSHIARANNIGKTISKCNDAFTELRKQQREVNLEAYVALTRIFIRKAQEAKKAKLLETEEFEEFYEKLRETVEEVNPTTEEREHFADSGVIRVSLGNEKELERYEKARNERLDRKLGDCVCGREDCQLRSSSSLDQTFSCEDFEEFPEELEPLPKKSISREEMHREFMWRMRYTKELERKMEIYGMSQMMKKYLLVNTFKMDNDRAYTTKERQNVLNHFDDYIDQLEMCYKEILKDHISEEFHEALTAKQENHVTFKGKQKNVEKDTTRRLRKKEQKLAAKSREGHYYTPKRVPERKHFSRDEVSDY